MSSRLAAVAADHHSPFAMPVGQAARLLGVSESFLNKARVRGDGPRFTRIGTAIRYTPEALRDYLRQNERLSTSEAA